MLEMLFLQGNPVTNKAINSIYLLSKYCTGLYFLQIFCKHNLYLNYYYLKYNLICFNNKNYMFYARFFHYLKVSINAMYDFIWFVLNLFKILVTYSILKVGFDHNSSWVSITNILTNTFS